MAEKNKDQKELKKFAGILFELKVGLSKDSMIVIEVKTSLTFRLASILPQCLSRRAAVIPEILTSLAV